MKNKRGWLRIFEAVIAILLITSVLLILIQKGHFGTLSNSQEVYTLQVEVLREIELDPYMRSEILSAELNSEEVPLDVVQRINNRMPQYFECKSKICLLEEICSLSSFPPEKDIYAQSVAIAANTNQYSPRQLKMFCWRK